MARRVTLFLAHQFQPKCVLRIDVPCSSDASIMYNGRRSDDSDIRYFYLFVR